MAGSRLNTLIRHTEQVESATTGNHSILALSNNRQFAAARSCIQCGCGTPSHQKFENQGKPVT